jgi:hypothetical protein
MEASSIDRATFFGFTWKHRGDLWRYLKWAGRKGG